ncbi:MAG: squalene--hopene cyclase [SAR202 cluster bacterium Io17-Chloro-G2]|nr:MAG: squalene--hopene cyclase [SAR202 cluster bacterium Io17-Chloro-G2]
MALNTSASEKPVPAQVVDRAIANCQDFFRRNQFEEGYWWARLEANPTIEAEYLLLTHFLGKRDDTRWRKIANYLLRQQSEDGSWAQYYEAPGDLSTSVECYFALKLAGHPSEAHYMQRARDFILSMGGVPQTRIFTKIWLAMFGQWDWKGTPTMPPEIMLLPTWAPFNIYEFSSWSRGTIVPMLVILTRRPTCEIPEPAAIDELYPLPRSETDYSLPEPDANWGWPKLLYYVDQALGLYDRLPIHPLRSNAERKIIEWLKEHQERDGSWGGIQPPWVYSLIALYQLGFDMDHPVMQQGFTGFEDFAIEDEETFIVQPCVSPVWDTCLAQIALVESGVAASNPMIQKSTRWLLDRQILESGDWQVRAKDTEPGGWSFEFENVHYPDIDDAAEVIIALASAPLPPNEDHRRQEAIKRCVDWMLGLQSKNGGWAAFDKDNNRKYLAKLPFSDFGELLDPPSVDVTAHLVEMFGKLGYTQDFPPVKRACDFIKQEQEPDGSWFGRWGVNYVYGIGAVLPAMSAIGEDMRQPYIRKAVAWLLDHQNEDGGWGESCASYADPDLRGVGPSTASQTAWSLLALMAAGEGDDPAVHMGVTYLTGAQTADGFWDEPHFTGAGFPGYLEGKKLEQLPKPGERGHQGPNISAGFMINYHLYRNYWPLLALGRFRNLSQGPGCAKGISPAGISNDHGTDGPVLTPGG